MGGCLGMGILSETVKKLKTRQEIDAKDKWKIEDIFASDEAWQKDFLKLEKMLETSCDFKGKLGQSANNLYEALKESDDCDWLVERIYVYAFMKYYEDTTNPVYQELSGKAQGIAVKSGAKYAFMVPEILEIPEDVLMGFLKDDIMSLYVHYVNDLLLEKEHTLSDKEEEILANARQIASAPNEIFSKFNNADVRFGNIKDEDGHEVELTNGRYSTFMESSSREVRKNAFTTLYKEYAAYINTLAATYNANVKQAIFYAKTRKYKSTIEMNLSSSFIPVDVYKNLIKTVHDNMGLMHKYVSIRKKALGVEKLHFYDVYAPMVSDYKMKVTYDEAKEIVKNGLAPLGTKYVDILEEGYNSGWVDVRESAGKRNGAFSWGTFGTHPYVFLNYSDSLNDVFTLAHEMGHAIHTYHSNENQPHVYAGYQIFVAEVASTCNEALLINYMLKNCTEVKEKMYLINHFLEQFKGTLFRQTMFAEYEMTTHKMAEEGQILNADLLCKTYRKLNEQYFGPDMEMDEEIELEWSRIPHFYTPFYVYQYATGFSAAIAISTKILQGDQKTIDGYFQFLSGGSSMHPIELLQLCGVDMSKPEPVKEALKVFEGLLDEFEQYLK